MYKIFEITEQGTLIEPTHREKITSEVYGRPEPTFKSSGYLTVEEARAAILSGGKSLTVYYILKTIRF